MDRKTLWSEFSPKDVAASSVPLRIVNRQNVAAAAAEYDVLFFQTVFPGIETISGTPLVSMQYGLAKEQHNYGEWRSLADLNLMYGKYSADRISHFSPSFPVGNIKFAGWDYRSERLKGAEAKKALGLDPAKHTVLFMPTYGELGSFETLVQPLAALPRDFEVVIKMHHNNEMSGLGWAKEAEAHGHRHLYHGGSDQRALLAAADVALSDFSGAIFDAVYAEVPVVLFQAGAKEKVGLQKFDLSSLEFRRRDEMGMVVEDVKDLAPTIALAARQSQYLVARSTLLRQELFIDGLATDIIDVVHHLIGDLLCGRMPTLSEQQLYVRHCVKMQMKSQQQGLWRRLAKLVTS